MKSRHCLLFPPPPPQNSLVLKSYSTLTIEYLQGTNHHKPDIHGMELLLGMSRSRFQCCRLGSPASVLPLWDWGQQVVTKGPPFHSCRYLLALPFTTWNTLLNYLRRFRGQATNHSLTCSGGCTHIFKQRYHGRRYKTDFPEGLFNQTVDDPHIIPWSWPNSSNLRNPSARQAQAVLNEAFHGFFALRPQHPTRS